MENIALGKPARQSSYSEYSTLNGAQGGVDGVKTGKYGFCTAASESPWWQVDLQGIYRVREIVLFNREDGGAERADNLRVYASMDGQEWHMLTGWSGGRFGGIHGAPARIKPADLLARHIRLKLLDFTYLHLDEVEVYGELVSEIDPGELITVDASFSF